MANAASLPEKAFAHKTSNKGQCVNLLQFCPKKCPNAEEQIRTAHANRNRTRGAIFPLARRRLLNAASKNSMIEHDWLYIYSHEHDYDK